MTHFVSFRAGGTGRSLDEPMLLTGDPAAGNLRLLSDLEFRRAVEGRQLLFGTHGFNTSYRAGALQLAQFDRSIALGGSGVFFGVLWPGDAAVPFINYPFEGSDAVECGRRLAALCNTRCAAAAGFSFVSHSLGGRLVLEAVRRLNRKARMMCLMAAAVDRDVLTNQYRASLRNCEHVYVLSSTRDKVLRIAYPAGDFLSDLFGDSDSPFRSALGLRGPQPAAGPDVDDSRIPADPPCDHMGYMPGGSHWPRVHPYIRRSFDRSAHSWPP
ncbi:MAG TPA: alpha/beta hydrolase [Allosphingosinicella sp.]|nr:alpha/beta hydrolase [Allosphingosinicella sp.]